MDEAVRAAIVEAQMELADINSKLEQLASLQTRKEVLERFIAASQDVLNDRRQTAVKPNGLTSPTLGAIGMDRLWEVAQIVMGIAKRPMTAGEVLEALTAQNIFVDGVHKRETVRSAMVRKEDIFEKTRRGMFALKSWPEHLKRLRDEEPVVMA